MALIQIFYMLFYRKGKKFIGSSIESRVQKWSYMRTNIVQALVLFTFEP